MIITKNILIELGADEESLSWLDQHNFYGLDQNAFTEAVYNESGREDWRIWCVTTLNSARAILLVPHEFFGEFKVEDNFFSTIESAREYARTLEVEHNKQFDYLYSVNSMIPLENGNTLNVPCNIYSEFCEIAPSYSAFDYKTNSYLQFETYTEAREHALQKKQERESSFPKKYYIEQQVKEIGGSVSAWSVVE